MLYSIVCSLVVLAHTPTSIYLHIMLIMEWYSSNQSREQKDYMHHRSSFSLWYRNPFIRRSGRLCYVPSPKPALDGSKQPFAIWIVLYYLRSSSRYWVLENTPSWPVSVEVVSGSVGLLREVEFWGAIFARRCGVTKYRYPEGSFLQHHRVMEEIVFHRIIGVALGTGCGPHCTLIWII